MPSLRNQQRTLIIANAALLLGLTSCGTEPTFVPVSGTVLKPDGKPVVAGHVMFWPIEDPKGFVDRHKSVPFAITDQQGGFVLAMNAKDSGCPPGKYQVTVSMIRPEDQREIPKRFTERQTTPWEVTVPRGGASSVVLQLERN